MHTMAKVKNELLAVGDTPEPVARVIGEEQVVEAADLIVANTEDERHQLIDLYDAEPDRLRVITPGVDLEVFRPGSQRDARSRLGIRDDALVLTFVGRIQPLKAPDVVIRAAADLLVRRPDLRDRLLVPVIGGPSGSGLDTPDSLVDLASSLGVTDVVRFVAPVEQSRLVDYYRAASLVCVPSYNESFGLVAIEAQACGTPVVAANVGGLPTAVDNGHSGVLVDGHDPQDYARVFEGLLTDDRALARLRSCAPEHAQQFGWARTAQLTLAAYHDAVTSMRADALALAE
jgi:D-inositol-3-phosphate glycosyltransferase